MNRVALITGAGSGIGRACVLQLYSEGYSILACDMNEDGLNETCKGLDSKRVEKMRMDVSNESDVKAGVDLCVKKFGSIHVMFANAGVSGDFGMFDTYTEKSMEMVFKVNVFGVFYCFKHAVLAMKELRVKDGCLIATSSVAGIRSGAGGAAYSASKAAVISIVQTVANQLTGTGIRCNAICPGIIETGMTKPLFDLADAKNRRGAIGQLNPLQRYGEPKEIATVVSFLSSSASSYVTGQAIAVDGGLSSSHPVAYRKPGQVSM